MKKNLKDFQKSIQHVETSEIYGFGSFFSKEKSASHDIDLLIVHQEINTASCQFAIYCKQQLKKLIAMSDITILSNSEEKEFDFVRIANALKIGEIRTLSFYSDIKLIIKYICKQRSKRSLD
jgi:peroxiredoxin